MWVYRFPHCFWKHGHRLLVIFCIKRDCCIWVILVHHKKIQLLPQQSYKLNCDRLPLTFIYTFFFHNSHSITSRNFVILKLLFYFFGEMFMNVKAVVSKICFLLTGQWSRKLHWPSQSRVEESPSWQNPYITLSLSLSCARV